MNPRQPLFFTIILVTFIITFLFFMIIENSDFIFNIIYWINIIIGLLVTFIIYSIDKLIEIKQYDILSQEEKIKFDSLKRISYYQRLKNSFFKKQINENQIIINHDCDNILELNNPPPNWWIFIFYFGIFFCFLYLCLFFFTNTFANPEYELKLEKIVAEQNEKEYWSQVTQPTVETVKLNIDYIEEGKELFNLICASCHKEGGIGGIGPNLTDEYWINTEKSNLIQNIFYLIWNGSKNNLTMRGFGVSGELNGIQIEKIANYVYYINKEKKHSKNYGAPPQGKKIIW